MCIRDRFYECAVTWASDAGITGGVTATKFAPLAKVKRAQMVVFLYRLADSPPVDDCSDHPFTDVPANAYYECAMTWAVGCLLYTSDAADERSSVDLGGRRILKNKTRLAF